MRYTGVTARGIVAPIFREGDDLINIVTDTVLGAAKGEGFEIQNGDIICLTESVLGRVQGNYATCEQIAADIKAKLGGKDMGIVFPILSRNRFSIMLKAMAMACEDLTIQLSYPTDEVGNALISIDEMDAKGVDPYRDNFDEAGFRAVFGKNTIHPFTGVDYIEAYKSYGKNIRIIFSNDPCYILNYTKNVLTCDIHTELRTERRLKAAGAERVERLDTILTESVDGSGWNPEFGLLGSNLSTDDKVKLFPRDAQPFVEQLQLAFAEKTGKHVECMVYGDGCFKDPVGGIWEFADPVVAPGFTSGLRGTPNELKMKYFADNELAGLSGEALAEAMREKIREKDSNLVGKASSLGTTPRRLTDLLGSLCDLTSGSGDRGTPIVLIQNYFTNFATE